MTVAAKTVHVHHNRTGEAGSQGPAVKPPGINPRTVFIFGVHLHAHWVQNPK